MKDYFINTNIDIFNKYEKIKEIEQSENQIKYLVKDYESSDLYKMTVMKTGDIRIYKKLIDTDNINIIKIISVTKLDEGELVVIEEYNENSITLQEKIDNTIDEGDFEDALLQICDALLYLHSLKKSIVYNLVTPDSIQIDKDNLIKLNDFSKAEYNNEIKNDVKMFGKLIQSSGKKFKNKYHNLISKCEKENITINDVRNNIHKAKRVMGIRFSIFILIFILLLIIARIVWIIFIRGQLINII